MFVCITEASAPGLHVAVRPASWAPRVRAGASGQGACTDSWQVAAQVPGGGPQCRSALPAVERTIRKGRMNGRNHYSHCALPAQSASTVLLGRPGHAPARVCDCSCHA